MGPLRSVPAQTWLGGGSNLAETLQKGLETAHWGGNCSSGVGGHCACSTAPRGEPGPSAGVLLGAAPTGTGSRAGGLGGSPAPSQAMTQGTGQEEEQSLVPRQGHAGRLGAPHGLAHGRERGAGSPPQR